MQLRLMPMPHIDRCQSYVYVNERRVQCRKEKDHPSDGATVFAFHSGCADKDVDAKRYTKQKDYTWATSDEGQDITSLVKAPRASKKDTLTLPLFPEKP